MAFTDKDNQPYTEGELKEHIQTALAVEPPIGRELEFTYGIIKRIFNPTVFGAENIPDRPCLFVGNHSLILATFYTKKSNEIAPEDETP